MYDDSAGAMYEQEEQLRKEQEVAGELKQKSRMYEAWIQKLIHQDEFLLNLSDNSCLLYTSPSPRDS